MTKSKTAGAKRRAKRGRITLAGGDSIDDRASQGRRRDVEQQTPPPIFKARARQCPVDAASTLNESDIGRCILSLTSGQECTELAQTWAAMSAAHRSFRMRVIGQTGNPQGAAAPMTADKMETDPSLRVDLRTPEERDDAAKRVWGEWLDRIESLPVPQMQWAIRGALDGFMGEGRLWRDGAATELGRAAVAGLRRVSE